MLGNKARMAHRLRKKNKTKFLRKTLAEAAENYVFRGWRPTNCLSKICWVLFSWQRTVPYDVQCTSKALPPILLLKMVKRSGRRRRPPSRSTAKPKTTRISKWFICSGTIGNFTSAFFRINNLPLKFSCSFLAFCFCTVFLSCHGTRRFYTTNSFGKIFTKFCDHDKDKMIYFPLICFFFWVLS